MKNRASACLVGLFLCFRICSAEIRLPRLIRDGMVLQRNAPVRLWGWADAGESVKLNFLGRTITTKADSEGKWALSLAALKAGGPYRMHFQGKNSIVLENVYIGDVWVCSGQSNMVLPMVRVQDDYVDLIAAANNPQIRYFGIPMKYDFTAKMQDLSSGSWEAATPQTILQFSATAYFFAKKLNEIYQVPIGLINASVGGTPVEAWMSEQAVRVFPELFAMLQLCKQQGYVTRILEQDKAMNDSWYQRLHRLDQGYSDDLLWYSPMYDDSDWRTMSVPSFWSEGDLGAVNGALWFRKSIDVPAEMTGRTARLLLGAIVDSDSVYVNGVFVGSTSYQYPPRKYTVADHVLKPGKNLIAVRVVNSSGKGGFIKDKPYQLIADGRSVELDGEWKYKVGAVMEPLPATTFIHYKPAGLFNAMIAPLLPYRIKGVIWYQGESNTADPLAYQRLFPALIADWRRQWRQNNFPFLFVQLANFMKPAAEPGESRWAELREAQRMALSVPNTAMAVTIDIGEWNDIHPSNKREVGRRVALAAQRLAYGEKNLVYSGPLYRSMKLKGSEIHLSFHHVGSGLQVKGGGELSHFDIAGADKRFIRAKARIKSDRVVVWQEGLHHPVAVRYAWADNPQGANLYNREGLPASPFRTDR